MIKFEHEGTKIFAHCDIARENVFNILRIQDLRETHDTIRVEVIDVTTLGLGQAEDLCASYEEEAAFFETETTVQSWPIPDPTQGSLDVRAMMNNYRAIRDNIEGRLKRYFG